MAEKNKFKIGIIGTGGIARAHADAYKNCPENPLDLTLCESCADVFFDSKKYYIVLALTDLDERNYCDICHQRKGRDLLLYERRNKGGGANDQNNCTR